MGKVLIFQPNGKIIEQYIDYPVEDDVLYRMVDGEIEEIPYLKQFEAMNIAFLQNVNSKFLKLEPTIRIVEDGKLMDVLCGNVLALGIEGEEYVGLEEVQVSYIKEKVKSGIVAIPTPYLIINE